MERKFNAENKKDERKMKKLFAICLIVGTAVFAYLTSIDFSKINRGQVRLKISRRVVCYLKKNNYCFPQGWDQMIGVDESRELEGVDYLENYTNNYTLPWGKSITNSEVMAGAWFKSYNNERREEDFAYSRWILNELTVGCTNDTIISSIDKALTLGKQGRGGRSGTLDIEN